MSDSFKIQLTEERILKGRTYKAGTTIGRGGSLSPLTADHVRKAIISGQAVIVPRGMAIPQKANVEVTVAEQIPEGDPEKEASEKEAAKGAEADAAQTVTDEANAAELREAVAKDEAAHKAKVEKEAAEKADAEKKAAAAKKTQKKSSKKKKKKGRNRA